MKSSVRNENRGGAFTASSRNATSTSTSPSSSYFQDQMDRLVALVSARGTGKLQNDDAVEQAVSQLLASSSDRCAGSSSSYSNKKDDSTSKIHRQSQQQQQQQQQHQRQQQKLIIQEDQDDYDDLEEPEYDNNANTTSAKAIVTSTAAADATAATATAPTNKEKNEATPQETLTTSTTTTIVPATTQSTATATETSVSSVSNNNDDNDNNNNNKTDESSSSSLSQQTNTTTTTAATTTTTKIMTKVKAKEMEGKYWDDMDAIPLGRAGARMLVTFGDGRKPKPETVSAALLGARKCLQNAIKDARAVRRASKVEYQRARVAANMHQPRRKRKASSKLSSSSGGGGGGGGGGGAQLGVDHQVAGGGDGRSGSCSSHPKEEEEEEEKLKEVRAFEFDNEIYYKILTTRNGHHQLAADPPCGFDVPQLQRLFPEEMNAYQRWNRMHQAYLESKNKNEEDVQDPAAASTTTKGEETSSSFTVGGHIQDRLAQFDERTRQMKEEWYLTFAEVRQGSFISKERAVDEKLWEMERKKRNKNHAGRQRTCWENLPATSVRFLHWVGFDQRSALPPPNQEVTEALAFLGYDFMGKIVEKAIFLRKMAQRAEEKAVIAKGRAPTVSDADTTLELSAGEQLEVQDIERALGDTTTTVIPLYSASTSSKSKAAAAQLYFGPGFEDRLEMELEEMVLPKAASAKQLTKEEEEIRKREDELFEKVAEPPQAVDGILDLLGDGELVSEDVVKEREKSKDRRRGLAVNQAVQFDAAAANNGNNVKPQKRKRGRPSFASLSGNGSKNDPDKPKRKRGRPRKTTT